MEIDHAPAPIYPDSQRILEKREIGSNFVADILTSVPRLCIGPDGPAEPAR
jgi:hypothetical protein